MKTEVSSGGIGLCGILTIIFVLCKVFDKIDWSWWWVFSPLWIPIAIVISIGGIVLGIAALLGQKG